MNNQQGLEAVDEEILQLERVLVRECINKKCRGKSTAGTSMSISGGEMAFDLHSKYLMCARDSCHPLRKKKKIHSPTQCGICPIHGCSEDIFFLSEGCEL